jgi:nucleoside-diphosphate-sugar epimerase
VTVDEERDPYHINIAAKQKYTNKDFENMTTAVFPPARVAVAGATGWLGGHVLDALVKAGYQVLALVRSPETSDTTFLQLHDKYPSLQIAVARCDVTDAASVVQACTKFNIQALISCIGLRDNAAPRDEVYRILRDGTIHLFRAVLASHATRFITVAGGIHQTATGEVRCEMIHNAAR